MSLSSLVNLSSLIDDAKCYELVRQHRWPEGVRCPHCDSASVTRHGHDDTQRHRQRYRCKQCQSRFDDLTGTVLAVDIGAQGAAALLDEAGNLLDVVDLPTLDSGPGCRPEISPHLFAAIVRRWAPSRA